jgi:hypothetical protein
MTRHTYFILLALFALLPVGCAGGFRAGGDRASVGAGVAVPPPPVAYPPR